MSNTLDISVIICTHDEARWEYLLASIESVQNQSVPPSEIIVVVDHNPWLFERVQAEIPGVIMIENQEEQGASGARNTGVVLAKGPIIAFMDDDAEAAPNWLDQLLSGYKDNKVLGVGGSLEPIWMSDKPAWFPEEFNWVVGCSFTGMPRTTTPVRNLISANMSMRRDIFEEVCGFRRGFGKVGAQSEPEETELCIRVLQHVPQGVWLYEPRAAVFHKVPPSRATWGYFIFRCYHEGLGKAAMVRFVGARDGLSSEKEYVFRTLPRGIIQAFVDVFFHFDITGLGRAGAIVIGLGSTIAGYLKGSLFVRLTNEEKLYGERKEILGESRQ